MNAEECLKIIEDLDEDVFLSLTGGYDYVHYTGKSEDCVSLDGSFTVKELTAIIYAMQNFDEVIKLKQNFEGKKKMRIIKPYFEIIQSPVKSALRFLEVAGRTCYKSEKKITQESGEEFCRKLIKSGHESVIEHAHVTARIVCDRGVSHKIVRHRLASYSQESTRYCNYGKDEHITFIKPCFFPEIEEGEYTIDEEYKEDAIAQNKNLSLPAKHWIFAINYAEYQYNKMIQYGCSPQEARSVLPNSLKTEIVMTANLREWRHFFKLRTARAAHPQMQEIARPMLGTFKSTIPVIFDDISWME